MTRLEDLIYSLATVIVGYHDSQGINKLVTEKDKAIRLEKTRAIAIQIIKATSPTFDERLKSLITECTDGYPLRKPFLHYLLNQLMFLHSAQSRLNSFDKDSFNLYTAEMAKMLTDFQNLITTPKSSTIDKIKYCAIPSEKVKESGNTTITLSGLKNDSYYGGEFCNSGELLHDEVLQRLNITTKTPKELIIALANDICFGHQNGLLVPELVSKNEKLDEELTGTKEALRLKTEQIESLTVQLRGVPELQSRNTALEETVAATREELRIKTEQTDAQIREKTATIESLTDQLRKVESKPTDPGQSAEALALKLAAAEERIKSFEIAQQKLEETIQTQKETISRLENTQELQKRFNLFSSQAPFFSALYLQKMRENRTDTDTQNPVKSLSPYSSTNE